MARQKIYLLNSLLFLFLISAFTIPPFIGESHMNLIEALKQSGSMSAEIVFGVRLPRIIFTFLVGAGLALVGAVYQALLRNDLATPYTLGVSSGGAFGAVLAIKTGIVFQFFGFSTVTVFSILGSLLAILIIYYVARNRTGISTFTLIFN